MGFRLRKSFGKGPFRINISKSGIGYSIGVKGARITKTAKGTKRTTLSVPGTGLSYVSETSGRRKRNRKSSSTTTPIPVPKSDNNTNTNTKGTSNSVLKVIKKILLYGFSTIIFLFLAFILIGVIFSTTSKTEIDENAPVATATATLAPTATLETTDTPAPSASSTAEPTAKPIATPTKASRTKPTAKPTEKPTATVAPTATAKPTEVPTVAPTSTPVPPPNDTVSQHLVWVSANGTKYHSNSSCSNMKNPKKVTYDEAIELGYEPCKKCN